MAGIYRTKAAHRRPLVDKFGAVHTLGSRNSYDNFINVKNTDISLIISYYSQSRLGKAAQLRPPVNLFPVVQFKYVQLHQNLNNMTAMRINTQMFSQMTPTQLLWRGREAPKPTKPPYVLTDTMEMRGNWWMMNVHYYNIKYLPAFW